MYGSETPVTLYLESTFWQLETESQAIKNLTCSVSLSPQLTAIWKILNEHYPNFVSRKTISHTYTSSRNNTTAQVSYAIYRLKKALANTPFKIKQNYQGEYASLSKWTFTGKFFGFKITQLT